MTLGYIHLMLIILEIRFEIYRYLVTVTPSTLSLPIEDDSHVNREMPILRANRQKNEEAASVLCSELTIMLFSGYVLGLENNAADLLIFKKPIEGIWRHDPLRRTGYTRTNGSQFYCMPEIDGSMEPHVFARFKKIGLHITVRLLDGPALLMSEDFNFEPADEAHLTRMLVSTSLMGSAAEVLSDPPLLYNLSLHLDTKVDLDDGEDGNGFPDPPSFKNAASCSELLKSEQQSFSSKAGHLSLSRVYRTPNSSGLRLEITTTAKKTGPA